MTTINKSPTQTIKTHFWKEEANPNDPFTEEACYCAGYDVYGDLLGKISWFEYLYLQIKGEKISPDDAKLFELLAIALANPGPRDHSVRAALSAGVGGSTPASAIMAALAVGAGQYNGARELFLASKMWESNGQDLTLWTNSLREFPKKEKRQDIWPQMEHPPGFDPYSTRCPKPVQQILDCLCRQAEKDDTKKHSALLWVKNNQPALQEATHQPISKITVAAAALKDLGFTPEEAEMLYLLLRLPGVIAHTLERNDFGWREHPFPRDGINLLPLEMKDSDSI